MKINSLVLNHHKILGTTKINLWGESEFYTEDIWKQYHTDILIEFDENTKGENFYTIIIGENGVGKTIFAKTILEFAIRNDDLHEKTADDYNKYSRLAIYFHHNKSQLIGASLGKLMFEYDLLNCGHYKNNYMSNFLNDTDKQFVYIINSAFDDFSNHKNSRLKCFNSASELSQTKFLFLKTLYNHFLTEKLQKINELLKNNSEWYFSLKFDTFAGNYALLKDNKANIIFIHNNFRYVNIHNFLELIEFIANLDKEDVRHSDLPNELYHVFDALFENNIFYQMFYDNKMNMKKLFCIIKETKTISSIVQCMQNCVTTKEWNIVKKWKLVDCDIDFQKNTIKDLDNNDIYVLGILESLNIIKININLGNQNIDNFSSGEQSILRIFSFFSNLPIEDKFENLVVFYDEPENSLHPKWQHNFLNYFKHIAEEVYQIKNSHFIFTTHSPLIVMKAGQQQNTSVVRFYRDEENNFRCTHIQDINSYSIEEILLDEFKISYRDEKTEKQVMQFLDNQDEELKNSDPIHSVMKSFELHNKIDELHKKLKNK